MKIILTVSVLVLAISSIHAQNDTTTTAQSTSTKVSSTTVSTPKPTTTKKPATTSTAKPSTTKPPTTSTTQATTEHTTAANKSTKAPTTLTTPTSAPTSIPNPPTVLPEPKKSFNVTQDGVACIILEFSCQFAIPYNNTAGKAVTAELNVGENATVSKNGSFCHRKGSGTKQQITLTWGNNALTLVFCNESKKYYASEVLLNYYTDEKTFPGYPKPDKVVKDTTVNQTIFSTSSSRSYQCKAEEDIPLNNGIVMSVSNLHVEAYRTNKGLKFSLAEVCSKDDKTSNIVPIAVGCALAALVLIVLIAYCVGRRRSRQRGYQSV